MFVAYQWEDAIVFSVSQPFDGINWYVFGMRLPTIIYLYYPHILHQKSTTFVAKKQKNAKSFLYDTAQNLRTKCATGVNNYPLNNILPSPTTTTTTDGRRI